VANALWALPWLIPPGQRYVFGTSNRALLRCGVGGL